jgi:uncharacterized protein YcfL
LKKNVTVLFLSMLLLGACSSGTSGKVDEVVITYWGQTDQVVIHDKEDVTTFVTPTMDAEKLGDQQIIKTTPLLRFEYESEDGITKKYHLWISQEGEGYIQSLQPKKDVSTYALENEAVKALSDFLEEKGFGDFPSTIEFE